MKKITLIYSGGSDSYTLLQHALNQNFSVDCITFSYGQKHIKEINFAKQNCNEHGLKHTLIDIGDPASIFGSTSLVDVDNKIPHGSYKEESMKSTIVPNRNMIFISYAIAYSIAHDINEVWYGAHAGDHFIYPDCRPEFLASMDAAAGLCDPSAVSIKAPFINLNKGEIFKIGLALGIDYSKTWTCYEGQEKACGKCGSCVERLEAFSNNNTSDPLIYS